MFGEILDTISQNPSISKAHRLHVVIFQFFYNIEMFSIDSSKQSVIFPEVLDFNQDICN
jgi:hypothetical protein